jgi:hypothetical protein
MKAKRDGNGVGLAVIKSSSKPAIDVLPVHVEATCDPSYDAIKTRTVALAQLVFGAE